MFRAQQEMLEARRAGRALQGANERRRKVAVSCGTQCNTTGDSQVIHLHYWPAVPRAAGSCHHLTEATGADNWVGSCLGQRPRFTQDLLCWYNRVQHGATGLLADYYCTFAAAAFACSAGPAGDGR
jgi:hypothetical protein